MTDHCDTCANFITCRKTVYDNGDEVIDWKADSGKGLCSILGVDVPETFGCHSYVPGAQRDHVVVTFKDGTPWTNWRMDACPDCGGRGSSWEVEHAGSTRAAGKGEMCHRCAGTGQVRHYDDGFIGDEQTRKHPKEAPPPAPKCANCAKTLDVNWVTCPWCGAATDSGRISICTQDSMNPDDPLALSASPIAARKTAIKQTIIESANNRSDQGYL